MAETKEKNTVDSTDSKKESKKTTTKSSSKKEQPKAFMPRRQKVYTFEQWAKRRGVKHHHKGGMRAYVQNINTSRTLEEWDDCFVNY